MALLRNVTTDRVIATRVERLSSFYRRAIGLLGRRSLGADEGAWIAPCSAIHTIGMRVPIDVVFLDAHGCIVRLEPGVRPNRPALACRAAYVTVELGCGALRGGALRVGDYLEIA